MIWIISSGLVSILLNDIPSFFRPYERLIVFVLVVGLVGPLIQNTSLNIFRQRLFTAINHLIVAMVLVSFFGIIVGLPIMIDRGGYIGLFANSMLLGPMSAIAILVMVHRASQAVDTVRWFYFVMAAFALLTCVAAGSRSALVAVIAGVVFYYYKTFQRKLTRFTRVVLVIVTICFISYPLWQQYTDRLMGKMAYGQLQGNLMVSRTFLWETRVNEFKTSPMIGVGFAAVDTSLSDRFDKIKGRVEPGSSWLAILSMIGLLGFIPITVLIFSYIRSLYIDNVNQTKSAFLGGLLAFFCFHMFAEGYVLSAGSGLFFYFWLVMGNIELHKNYKEQRRVLR
jgi:hypothetical protein